ncbi:GNAT family N-acetyltransferase [Bacillus sp. 1P06AnD]|uniref:GNAT family N-acetyltransferase n=1 Tax=Bacillus sp. 1P06AnD TaxID=3132208 RepID=UPI0039A3E244
MIYTSSLDKVSADMLHGFFVGWMEHPDVHTHLQLLKNSYKAFLAIDDKENRIAGFITAISDGVLSAYIPLLEVLPEYQNNGVGKELVLHMLEELNCFYMIDLMCDQDLVPYYEKLGLVKANGMIARNYGIQSGKIN